MVDAKWIPITDMVLGGRYVCIARNFDIGTWNGKEFKYRRAGQLGTELHWDNGEPHGTVKPFVLLSLDNDVINTYKSRVG